MLRVIYKCFMSCLQDVLRVLWGCLQCFEGYLQVFYECCESVLMGVDKCLSVLWGWLQMFYYIPYFDLFKGLGVAQGCPVQQPFHNEFNPSICSTQYIWICDITDIVLSLVVLTSSVHLYKNATSQTLCYRHHRNNRKHDISAPVVSLVWKHLCEICGLLLDYTPELVWSIAFQPTTTIFLI